jgi:hypothetical protein
MKKHNTVFFTLLVYCGIACFTLVVVFFCAIFQKKTNRGKLFGSGMEGKLFSLKK